MTIFDEDMNLKWHYRRFNYYRRLMAITYGAMVLSIPAGFVVSIWSEEIGLRVILGGGGSLALSHFTHWIQGNITSAIMDARAREKELREEAEKDQAAVVHRRPAAVFFAATPPRPVERPPVASFGRSRRGGPWRPGRASRRDDGSPCGRRA